MPNSAPRFKDKTKREIADEAFAKYGKEATRQQLDEHFRTYKLPYCERSMYTAAKRRANGRPELPRRMYPRYREKKDVLDIVARVKQLAADVGGYEALEKLINILRV